MEKIVFATNNKHKLEEVQAVIGDSVELVSLSQIHCSEDIPETADTLEENALLKARFIWNKYGFNCFADDTGLEVTALNNAPGVYSARYAGEEKDSEANMKKVVEELKDKEDKSAQFRTVIALIIDGKEFLFEGIIRGRLIEEKRGGQGFGYDPIFVPEGHEKTFAELGNEVKNTISHRALATNKLKTFLYERYAT
jgi:non-canonical purine NTP pyrophosphatase, rdgB/HAM1 family